MLERITETYNELMIHEPLQQDAEYFTRKLHEETDEAKEHIIYQPPTEEYMKEQADVFICWLGMNEAMGVPVEVALQAVQLKLEDLIVRAESASTHEDFWAGWELAKK